VNQPQVQRRHERGAVFLLFLAALLIVGLHGLKGGAHALFGTDMQDLVIKAPDLGLLALVDRRSLSLLLSSRCP